MHRMGLRLGQEKGILSKLGDSVAMQGNFCSGNPVMGDFRDRNTGKTGPTVMIGRKHHHPPEISAYLSKGGRRHPSRIDITGMRHQHRPGTAQFHGISSIQKTSDLAIERSRFNRIELPRGHWMPDASRPCP